MRVWGLIPARGGSKSIPLKNLAPIAGRPMLEYVAALAAKLVGIEKVIGSTDHPEIAEVFRAFGHEVHNRSAELSNDLSRVDDLAREIIAVAGPDAPDALLLLQPTSPFCEVSEIHSLMDELRMNPDAMSAQTITRVPHNSHEWNQRLFVDGLVEFVHKAERRSGYRKQEKPSRWVFGNAVITRCEALSQGEDFFAEPSRGIEIGRLNSFDIDDSNDLIIADAISRCWWREGD